MDFFVQQVINGLFLGILYALIALGFTFIWGVMGVANLAHIAIFPLTMFLAAFVVEVGAPIAVALPVALLMAIVAGLLIERLVIRPLRSPSRAVDNLAVVMATLGATIALENILGFWKGARNLRFPYEFPGGFWHLSTVLVSKQQFGTFVFSMVLMAGLFFWVRQSKMGKAMRAAAENPEAAGTLGIDVSRLIVVAVIISTAMAGVAGLLYVVVFGTYNAYLGFGVALNGFVAMLAGGLGSFPGAVMAALLLGVSQALAVGYISSSLAPAIAFGLLIAVMLIRPAGMLHRGRSG